MATFERKCGACGKWAFVDGTLKATDPCPFCRADYGPVGLGDRLSSGAPGEFVDPKTVGRKKPVPPAEEPKLPAPGPGEQGYRPLAPKRGQS